MTKVSNIEISDRLRKSGISPSLQRMEIYGYILKMKNHPTVDIIFKNLSDKIPTLSKTTVYNTLKLFVEKGIIIEILIDKNETRYDANVNTHGHFMTEETGEIHDMDVDVSGLNPEILDNSEVKEYHIYFKGKYRNNGKSNE